MPEPTTIGDYEVRRIERAGSVVRYAATHVVLPRRAIIEIVAADAPRADAMQLMRRACILEALQHPAVPRAFECGRLDGRPWFAMTAPVGASLHDEGRALEIREALTLLEGVAACLSHAHSRGVLHGNITPAALVRTPTLQLLRWENVRIHDGAVFDGSEDVLSLGTTVAHALARPDAVPVELARLLASMLGESSRRPSASEVVSAVRAIRDAIGAFDRVHVDRVIDALADEAIDTAIDEAEPEIVIVYSEPEAEPEPAREPHEEDIVLLDRRRIGLDTVIVDLEACG